MKRFVINKYIIMLLCLILMVSLFSGCQGDQETDQANPSGSEDPNVTDEPEDATVYPSDSDGVFSLNFDPEESFNPLTGTNEDNLRVSSLLYEGLFSVDQYFQAVPVLCESFSTDDGITYTFTIKSGISMAGGSTLTARDVAYSINRARESDRYSSRLRNIESVTAVDNLKLTVILVSANYSLPVLLDVPVIKNGSIGERLPDGTGPYVYTNDETPYLQAFSGYRDYNDLPIDKIGLRLVSGNDLSESFSEQTIDLLDVDPTGTNFFNISIDYESRYYNTTNMQYIGINLDHAVLSNHDVRRAISSAVDREYIVNTIMSGHGLISPLVISPAWSLYDVSWEENVSYSLETLSTLFSDIGMQDINEDGYLEYPKGAGQFTAFKIDFIANSDNEYKLAAAQRITDTLKSVGINITLRELNWSDYMSAIESGDFDMYYGEVRLTADFDLSELLTVDGSLNYGGITENAYSNLVDSFLSASDNETSETAASQLCAYVAERAPIIPVLYKEYAVLTHRGIVAGINPSQSNIFNRLSDWTITIG